MNGNHDNVHETTWTRHNRELGLTDPHPPPPIDLTAVAFHEFWLDYTDIDEDGDLTVLGIAVEGATDELINGLRAEPGHLPRIATECGLLPPGPDHGELIMYRITAAGNKTHRMDLLIPATNTTAAMCSSADDIAIYTVDDLNHDRAAGTLNRPVVTIPNDDWEFWVDIAAEDFSQPDTTP